MKFTALPVSGAFVIDLDLQVDSRGSFMRLFAGSALAEQGLVASVAQINSSFTLAAGTIRGLHYQTAPAEEAKVIRCVRGRVFDVIADVRRASPTFGTWTSVALSAEDVSSVYIPPGCAHGFMSLIDASEVIYTTSAPYSQTYERVLRWDDPFFEIAWPMPAALVSQKDSSAADFADAGAVVTR
jgi:dTDP-4-dehydrorhamnose 3,5-epimerase